MIPVEAVEAAAQALKSRCGNWDSWEVLAATALEAAAPHIVRHFQEGLDAMDMGPRSVWHDAVSEAYVEGALSAEQANVMWAKNPYRQVNSYGGEK